MSFGSGDSTRRDAIARSIAARVNDERRTIAELRRVDAALGEIERIADGDPLRVYVAGSSTPDEMDRVEGIASTLIAYGIEVVSSWPASVRAQGEGNPPNASRVDRLAWSSRCIAEVIDADVVLFLVPRAYPTSGAWFELAIGWSHGKRLVCSGVTTKSIFCATAEEFVSDLDAIAHVVAMHRQRIGPLVPAAPSGVLLDFDMPDGGEG
jgi:hypothetical protein